MLEAVPEKCFLYGNKEEVPPLETFSALSALEFGYRSFYMNMGNEDPFYSDSSAGFLTFLQGEEKLFFRTDYA